VLFIEFYKSFPHVHQGVIQVYKGQKYQIHDVCIDLGLYVIVLNDKLV